MKKDTAHKLDDDINSLKQLAGLAAGKEVEESIDEGKMSDMLIHDSETLSKEEFSKKHGKDVADEYYEAAIGAPDYNPAKASAGGPGYASMPQQVKLAGDSIWDKENTNPPMVTITDYEMVEEEGYVSVTVEHDGPWTIYTDSGFEEAISDMIGMEVSFSEQGMQEDGRAHLEGSLEESADISRLKQLSGIAMEDVDQQYADVLASKNQIKINAFLQGLDSKTATRLTGGQAQTSKISSDGQSISPSGDPYKHGEPGLSKQTIKMTKPIAGL